MSNIAEELNLVATHAKAQVTATKSALTPDLNTLRHESIQLRQQISQNEELQAERKRVASDQIKQTLTTVANHCNVIVEAYMAKFDGIVEKIKASTPPGTDVQIINSSSVDRAIKQSQGFIVHSNIHRITPLTHTNGDVDANLRAAETEADVMLSALNKMFITVVTPPVDRGNTRNIENHTRYSDQNRIFEDRRKEIFEDAGLLLLKKLLGDECGNVEVLHSSKQLSRDRKHVVINPSACYWSGEADYDEVAYQHFFRWAVKIPLSLAVAEKSSISHFQISSLTPTPDFEI